MCETVNSAIKSGCPSLFLSLITNTPDVFVLTTILSVLGPQFLVFPMWSKLNSQVHSDKWQYFRGKKEICCYLGLTQSQRTCIPFESEHLTMKIPNITWLNHQSRII